MQHDLKSFCIIEMHYALFSGVDHAQFAQSKPKPHPVNPCEAFHIAKAIFTLGESWYAKLADDQFAGELYFLRQWIEPRHAIRCRW